MNPINVEPFVKACWPTSRLFEGLSEQVWREHQLQAGDYPLTEEVVLACRCGWYQVVRRDLVLYLDSDRMARDVFQPWADHIADVRRLYAPTLADMRDWGWFNVEAGQ